MTAAPPTAAQAAPHAPPDAEARDAAAIDCGDWPDRTLTGPTAADRDGRFQVVYRQSALDAIHLHGQTRTDVELCGVLLGTGCRDAHGPYLLVEHAIPGTSASSRSTNVTFTADTWQQIQTVMDRDFPDKKMVGWYHTHPGFGIFLSGMDVFICDNFFNLPWQVAFVYDPIGGDEGNFVWRGGRPIREPVLLEDDVTPQAAAVPLMPVDEAMTGSDPALASPDWSDPALPVPGGPGLSLSVPGGPGADLPPDRAAALESQAVELMARVRLLERRLKVLVFAMLFMAVFVAVGTTLLLNAAYTNATQPPLPGVVPPPMTPTPPPPAPPSGRAAVPKTPVGH